MDNFSSSNNSNIAYLEDLYKAYLKSPESVDEGWRRYFSSVVAAPDKASGGGGASFVSKSQIASSGGNSGGNYEAYVTKLIQAYRSRGHQKAKLNPLDDKVENIPELKLEYHGLREEHLNQEFESGKEVKIGKTSLRNIIDHLEGAYCSSLGVEFTHCNDRRIRVWLYDRLEPVSGKINYSSDKKRKIFYELSKASIFEDFLQKKYIGQKRFGLEGGESLIPALAMLIERGSEKGVDEFVFGMAHRGRLNVLVNIFKKSYFHLFTEFEGGLLPENVKGDGDVKYHLGQSADIELNGKDVHLTLAFNPSHLEAVNPIVEGMVKAKCKKYYSTDQKKITSIIIHGDAAVAGQGVNYELANMSKVRGYDNGGTIHVVINNQIGFTAGSHEGRSSKYCTELAKMSESPIFHVNGDDVEKVVYAFELAIELRQEFGIDVWIDLMCYRKRGHNESDEPRFTQPIMYDRIAKKKTIYQIYLEKITTGNVYTKSEIDSINNEIKELMESEFDEAKKKKSSIQVDTLDRYWQKIRPSKDEDFIKSPNTRIDRGAFEALAEKIFKEPTQVKGINLFSKLKRILENRKKLFFEDGKIDWAMGETLAYGSLLSEGKSVRLSGQDSVRGTFSHRHSFIKDVKNESTYNPLQSCIKGKAQLRVLNSPLSEYSVLGFEYGYSLSRPHALVIWEAQFGDFANGAQIIIDQFITSAESKWQRRSGLVMLLPHGYEGMGPEHSSARLERFLQCCADNNVFVVNITTPANLFHALRRQIHSQFRIPLIVMSPKSLLRHPDVVSLPEDFTDNDFLEVIDDTLPIEKCKKVMFCTGKIYYDIINYKRENKVNDVAIVRLEQLYPLKSKILEKIIKKYSKIKKKLWVQEEPKNMGAWQHINFYLGDRLDMQCISRAISSSPASGMKEIHSRNQEKILVDAFKY